MNQSYAKLSSNGPSKFSSRKHIFGQKGGHNSQNTSNDDSYRITAKIRSLEDDLKVLLNENQQIDRQNKQLVHILQELEYIVSTQQARIQDLNGKKTKNEQATSAINEYEKDLKVVGEQIVLLNQLINQKNSQHRNLNQQREDALYENIKLKEQSNLLLFRDNAMHQEFNHFGEIEENQDDSLTFNEDIEQKIQTIINQCHNLAQQIQQKQAKVQNNKKKAAQTVMSQKQKRIQLQFKVKLLRQRKNDFQKQKNFLKTCYNQESIQKVIDDMLRKEDALRQDIDEQITLKNQIVQQHYDKMNSLQKVIGRERNKKLDQIKMQVMQSDMIQKDYDNRKKELQQVEARQKTAEDGLKIDDYLQLLDDDVFKEVKLIEAENVKLQAQFNALKNDVQFIQKQLSF